MADKTLETTKPVPTIFSNIAAIAAFLAWKYLRVYKAFPTVKQLNLYRGEDGMYSCAVQGCTVTGSAERIKKSERGQKAMMVTMGPVVLCHDHGCECLKEMKGPLGQPDSVVWYPLSKTMYFAEDRDSLPENPDDDDRDMLAKRMTRADEEMAERAEYIAEAIAWSEGHREYIARTKTEAEERAESKRLAGLPPAPEVNPYMGKTVTQLKKLADAAAEALQVLEEGKGDLTEADYATMLEAYKHTAKQVAEAIVAVEQAEKQKVAERQSAGMFKKLAALNAKLGLTGNMTIDGIRVELCLSPSGGTKPATKPATTATNRQTAGAAKGTLAQFPCNCNTEIKGDPNEGLDSIKPFKREDFRTHEDCRAALGDTRDKWQNTILLGHAPEGAERDDVLGSGPGNKAAKDKVKACKLHAPLFRVILGLRGPVNKLFSEQWPEEYAKYRAHGGHNTNGHTKDTGELQCAECPPTAPKVNKLFAKPLSVSEVEVQGKDGKVTGKKLVFKSEMIWDKNTVTGEMQETSLPKLSLCGKCLQAAKSRLTKPIREKKAADKRQCDKALRAKMVKPNEGSGQIGNYKKKHAKKGKH